MVEVWRAIPGYDRYEVSSFGRVRSVDHVDSLGRSHSGRLLKQVTDGLGNYLYVSLTEKGKPARRFSVHRLVASAFVENPDGLSEINHKDEDKRNNVADNLEWCSHSYNNSYNGKGNGERNSQSRLKECDAKYIKEHPEDGTTALAKRFGISLAETSAIIHGKRWAWL